MNNLQLMTVFVLVAALAVSVPLQSVYAESGFTNVKKTAGVIMKFCANEVFTLQDGHERYDQLILKPSNTS